MEDRPGGLGHLLVPEGDLAALAAQTLFRSGEARDVLAGHHVLPVHPQIQKPRDAMAHRGQIAALVVNGQAEASKPFAAGEVPHHAVTARVVQRGIVVRVRFVGTKRACKSACLEVLGAVEGERGAIGIGFLHAARVERHIAAFRTHVVHLEAALRHLVHELRRLAPPQAGVSKGYEDRLHRAFLRFALKA